MDDRRPSPIFIVGVHRSGTTLLRFILSSHPRIYIPPESDFIPRFFQRHPDQSLSASQVERLLTIIFENYRFVNEWRGKTPDPLDFYQAMPGKNPAGFLEALYSSYARQYNAERWGDKTPIYASYVDLVATLFPAAYFLHIIRDPRDAAVSLLDKYAGREFHIDRFFAARNWVRRIQKARRDGNALGPERYLEIRYEDLVQSPQLTIEKVCRFIREDFHPAMLQHAGLAKEQIPEDSHFFDQVRKPINTGRIGRWQTELPDRDVRLIETVAGNLMAETGYPKKFERPMNLQVSADFLALGSKYALLQSGRKMLELAGIVPPI